MLRATRGQSTIEFALVFIFIFIPVLIGLADVARTYYEHLAVVNAAKVAARWAGLTPVQRCGTGYGSVDEVVRADLDDVPIGIRGVQTPVITETTGSRIEVTVSYTHTLLFGLVGGRTVFTGSASMPILNQQSLGGSCTYPYEAPMVRNAGGLSPVRITIRVPGYSGLMISGSIWCDPNIASCAGSSTVPVPFILTEVPGNPGTYRMATCTAELFEADPRTRGSITICGGSCTPVTIPLPEPSGPNPC